MPSHWLRKCCPSFVAAAVALTVAGCVPDTSNNLADRGDRPAGSLAAPAPTPVVSGPSVATDTTVIARSGTLVVTRGQLDEWLYKSYGINLLGDLIELRMAEDALGKAGQPPVTDADVAAERQRQFAKMFEKAEPADYPEYFRQLLQQKHMTAAEFDIGFRTTAVLRKLVRPQIVNQISDHALRQAFGILYGENRRIQDISVDNLAEASKAFAELKAGVPFVRVVREMSQDPRTKANNGVWPPFSAETPTVPKVVLDATFALQHEGDVSHEALSDGTHLHIIKLLSIMPPKLFKFEDVTAEVRDQVADQLEQSGINQYRQVLNQVAVSSLHIEDPTLRHQWDLMAEAQHPKATLSPADVVRREPPPATRPAAAPMGPVAPH